MMPKKAEHKLTPSPGLKKLFDAEKGVTIAAGSPRFFEDLERERTIPAEDVQILQRMIQQYGESQVRELVATLAK